MINTMDELVPESVLSNLEQLVIKEGYSVKFSRDTDDYPEEGAYYAVRVIDDATGSTVAVGTGDLLNAMIIAYTSTPERVQP